ncbi:MAG: hypothetical protein Q7T11_02185, partial [Deltaproteobacteria bacterium]|nr:hypothetical protein [Deltaproteobacteria bacterium]
MTVNNFLRLEAELGSGSLLTDEERAALHSLDNDGQLEERLLDPSDSIARAIDKLLYAKGQTKSSWAGSPLFRVPQILPEEVLQVADGDYLIRRTADGFSVLGRIALDAPVLGGIRIHYEPGVMNPPTASHLSAEELTAVIKLTPGLEAARLSQGENPEFERVTSWKEYAENMSRMAQEMEAALQHAQFSARPDAKAVRLLREHTARLIEKSQGLIHELQQNWVEKIRTGINAASRSVFRSPLFGESEIRNKLKTCNDEIETARRLIAEIEAGMIPDSAAPDIPPAIRAILLECFKEKRGDFFTAQLDAVKKLRREGRLDEALMIAQGIKWAYRWLNEE